MTHQPETAPEILRRCAEVYAERNAVYGDNWRMVGRVMAVLFGDNPPPLETWGDWNRLQLFMLKVVKLTRYAQNYHVGGHADSLEDDAVYTAMLAQLDQELKREEDA